ncbi:hypothetical protein ACJO2E_02385 [Marinobacter sp. M1N3S26]|uniref:hypothetical protein n=1 Tax=Marinobacter sp. M1N3S26 TaxID=3382299 RepID=UPI00387AFA9D
MASKSLGTLTLDLVAKVGGFTQGMDQASRKSQQTAKQIEKYSNQIGAALTAATAAGVTGMAALVTSTAEGAREIRNFAELSDASTQQFQRITYAASRYNLEQEKVADILKDTNDRVGDFIQTGGGPMADFFENIAPLVGVTADEFARLSGPEALQLYFDSLQKANVSQKDMTFYMEAIASDASLLIPLLRDGGAEMERLGDEAERTGNVFSDLEFEQLETITRGMDELTAAATGMKNEVVLAAIPAINDLIEILTDPQTIEAAQDLGGAVVTSVNAAVQTIKGAIEVTQFLAEELAALTAGAAADDVVRLQEELEGFRRILENPTERLRFFGKDGVVKLYDEDEIRTEIARLERQIAEAQDRMANNAARSAPDVGAIALPELEVTGDSIPRTGFAAREASKAAAEAEEEAAKKAAEMMRDYRDLVRDLQTEEELLSSQLRERLDLLDAVDEATEQDYSRVAAAAFQDSPDFSGISPEIGGPFSELNKIDEERERLEEWHQTQLDMLAQYREDRADLAEQWNEQERQIEQEHQDKLLQIESARQQAQLASAESLLGNLSDVTATFAGEQSDLYKTLFTAQKAAAIAQSAVAIQSGIAQAAANPWPANLAAMASVAAATAGIIGNIQSISLNLDGQAHDGIMSVPQDGTWNLKKGERVTTQETSAKLDATLDRIDKNSNGGTGGTTVNVIENKQRAGQTETTVDSEGRESTNVFVSDIYGRGPRAKALEQVYGLKRQGR